jgi:hypothetical protein
LSGVVFRTTSQGRQPVSGVRILISCEYDAYYLCNSYEVTSDATGRYSFPELAQFGQVARVTVPSPPAGLFQACAVHPTIGENTTEDIELVPAGAPPTTARSPTLSGVVSEDIATGRRPVADVRIAFLTDSIRGDMWDAETRTDADGRYRLCNLPSGPGLLWAMCSGSGLSAGRPVRSRIEIRGDTSLDVDFTNILENC